VVRLSVEHIGRAGVVDHQFGAGSNAQRDETPRALKLGNLGKLQAWLRSGW
jgi:hypothetical protein